MIHQSIVSVIVFIIFQEMDEGEISASDDGTLVKAETVTPSPTKPAKRGRGRPKKTRTESSDNESSLNGSQQIASLKHVGKFRYLSEMTRPDDIADSDPTKPVASRGRGRGRGRARGRGASNHVITPPSRAEESPSQVSSRGRRIKPNNRWTADTNFDASPPKTPTGRGGRRRGNGRAAKKAADDSSIDPPVGTVVEDSVVSKNEPDDDFPEFNHSEMVPIRINGVVNDECQSVESLASSPRPAVEATAIDCDSECTIKSTKCADEEALGDGVVNSSSVAQTETGAARLLDGSDIPAVVEFVADELSGEVTVTASRPADYECLPSEVAEDDQSTAQETLVSTPDMQQEVPSSSSSKPESLPTPGPEDVIASESVIFVNEQICHVSSKDESAGSVKEASFPLLGESTTSCMKEPAVEHPNSSSAGNTPVHDDETVDSQSALITPKPVKVKSRWRRTSELEQVVGRNGNSDQSSCNNSPLTMSPKSGCTNVTNRADHSKELNRVTFNKDDLAVIEERLKSFELMEENLYRTSKKISKEVKRMLCDCTLTKEEISRGELGCGEDCINRLLMIEW